MLPEARNWPSGLNARAVTSSACPCKVRKGWPVAVCHSRTVWSALPVASTLPSLLTARHLTGPPWPSNTCRSLKSVTDRSRAALGSAPPTATRRPSGW
jgi:hypothetical protein